MPKGLREIRRKIKSVVSTQQITRAMKMVASAKLQRSQNKTRSAQPYSESLIRLTEHLARIIPAAVHPFLERQVPQDFNKVLLIVFTSDRGLCGSFNANIVRAVEGFAKDHPHLQVHLYTIGRYAYRYFSRRGWQIYSSRNAYDFSARFIELYPLFEATEKAFLDKEFAEIYVAYSRFVSTMRQVPTILKLLPVERKGFADGADAHGDEEPFDEAIFEPSPQRVLEILLPRFVRHTLFQAMRENFTSENAARMVAMDNATKNAGELITTLTLQRNKLRQQSITLELLDIVGGAEALKG